MLRELHIKNLAIIDDLTIRFETGLNIISGETGAGKSIIVDALGLALGDRAQSDLVKSGKKEAMIQAYFEIDNMKNIPDIEMAFDLSEGLILRRIISASGKSRAYLNDTQVTLQTLSEICKQLVDIHSQHEHQSLLRPAAQREIIDSYGKLQPEVGLMKNIFTASKVLRDEMTDLSQRIKERAHRIDLLRYQIQEIQSASLRSGEKDQLEEEQKIQANTHKLSDLIETAYSLLKGGDGPCTEKLRAAISCLREIKSIDSSVGVLLENLEQALPLIEDSSFELRDFSSRYEFDPKKLELLEDRIEVLKRLEKKYGDGAEAIIRYAEEAEAELTKLERSDERLAALDEELRMIEVKLMETAKNLSLRREKTARDIETKVGRVLEELSFDNAKFEIRIHDATGEEGVKGITANGADHVEFLFSANKGEPAKPLTKVISGGELSRVMLAIKSILAEVDAIPVLIFDEVDAGIGGRTAEQVGKKLNVIAKSRQLLCITHLPQIARFGNHHLKIEKISGERKVNVIIKELRDKERRDEIARMLSGEVTEISRKHAGELLENLP